MRALVISKYTISARSQGIQSILVGNCMISLLDILMWHIYSRGTSCFWDQEYGHDRWRVWVIPKVPAFQATHMMSSSFIATLAQSGKLYFLSEHGFCCCYTFLIPTLFWKGDPPLETENDLYYLVKSFFVFCCIYYTSEFFASKTGRTDQGIYTACSKTKINFNICDDPLCCSSS